MAASMCSAGQPSWASQESNAVMSRGVNAIDPNDSRSGGNNSGADWPYRAVNRAFGFMVCLNFESDLRRKKSPLMIETVGWHLSRQRAQHHEYDPKSTN
jgi:hypothetical protein